MFGVVWRKGDSVVLKENSTRVELKRVIASCQARASEMKRQFPNSQPDNFVVLDSAGNTLRTVQIN